MAGRLYWRRGLRFRMRSERVLAQAHAIFRSTLYCLVRVFNGGGWGRKNGERLLVLVVNTHNAVVNTHNTKLVYAVSTFTGAVIRKGAVSDTVSGLVATKTVAGLLIRTVSARLAQVHGLCGPLRGRSSRGRWVGRLVARRSGRLVTGWSRRLVSERSGFWAEI